MDMVVGMPVVQMLLLAIMFLAIMVEIKTGGLGAGILLGLVAAGVFWGSQYVKGLVSLYQIAIFMGGILCIIVEMLLPTLYAMLISFVAAIVIFALIVKRLPSSKLWNKVVLKDESRSERGFVSAAPRESLLGAVGEVLTELRPSGSVRLNGKPVDVVSEGAFVPKGVQVQVVAVEGNRVVVRQI